MGQQKILLKGWDMQDSAYPFLLQIIYEIFEK